MNNYIIYHSRRETSIIDGQKIYHDPLRKNNGNQDPFIWNKKFLHTYCHMTQIQPIIGTKIFWVSGDRYPDFSSLFCDCVFVVDEICRWTCSNYIDITDPIVDTQNAFEGHYRWAELGQHQFDKRSRHTLKGGIYTSFQPQTESMELLDIVPFLLTEGLDMSTLHKISKTRNLKRLVNSIPFKLEGNLADSLYNYLLNSSSIQLRGEFLEPLYPLKSEL